jgi:hypothetical protein
MNRFLFVVVLTAAGCSGASGVEFVSQAICQPGQDCCGGSPIIIDVAGDGIHLTSWEDGVEFSLRKNWSKTKWAWTEANSDDAWLVLDRDSNGTIDSGWEMFGNFSPQIADEGETKNGFVALRVVDDNEDGIVDSADPSFFYLRLWQDKNHDGISQPGEMKPLTDFGITGLSTNYHSDGTKDSHGNDFRYSGSVYVADASNVGMTAYDVWLVGIQPVRLAEKVTQALATPTVPQPPTRHPTLYKCNVEGQYTVNGVDGNVCKTLQSKENELGSGANTGATLLAACTITQGGSAGGCNAMQAAEHSWVQSCNPGGGLLKVHPDSSTDSCTGVGCPIRCQCACVAPESTGCE